MTYNFVSFSLSARIFSETEKKKMAHGPNQQVPYDVTLASSEAKQGTCAHVPTFQLLNRRSRKGSATSKPLQSALLPFV